MLEQKHGFIVGDLTKRFEKVFEATTELCNQLEMIQKVEGNLELVYLSWRVLNAWAHICKSFFKWKIFPTFYIVLINGIAYNSKMGKKSSLRSNPKPRPSSKPRQLQ